MYMTYEYPSKVLISGGHEVGGVGSFADALRIGFTELGIPVEIVSPSQAILRYRELRDPRVLKILSTSAVFAAPLARRALCIAHGFPCAKHQGWMKTLAILGSYRLATMSRGSKLVVVSAYGAAHLESIFGLRVDAVVRNPVQPLFLEPCPADQQPPREAITYVGRLHYSKSIDRLIPAMRDVLDENPGMCAWIIGDGPMRSELERATAGDERFQFFGALSAVEVRDRLRRTRVFVSGCVTEGLGIAYIEALSQGCAVAMPATGGGLEIAPECVGHQIQLFSPSLDRRDVSSALRKAINITDSFVSVSGFAPRAIASAYLAIGRPSSEGDPFLTEVSV
jgi:glycosyltransferase involved in cell wall biosynthesis